MIIISHMSVKKSPGYDDITPTFLRRLAHVFSPYLAKLFQNASELAVFPDCFKIAKVMPLHKTGPKTELTNCRPISLLSSISIIFKKLIPNRFIKFFDKHNVIYNRQFGFRKKHSTQHVICDIASQCYENIENKKYTCLIFLDIKKAFDTVNHQILLQKMRHNGVRGIANDLIKSYLQNRLQYIEINHFKSSLIELTSGIPQESILGLSFFIIHLNDLAN